jgi:hypothetical protein
MAIWSKGKSAEELEAEFDRDMISDIIGDDKINDLNQKGVKVEHLVGLRDMALEVGRKVDNSKSVEVADHLVSLCENKTNYLDLRSACKNSLKQVSQPILSGRWSNKLALVQTNLVEQIKTKATNEKGNVDVKKLKEEITMETVLDINKGKAKPQSRSM